MGRMKKELRSAGPGARAAERMLSYIARVKGANLRTVGDDFLLAGGPTTTEVRILASPANHSEWNTRFEWLEKQAASFLLKAPLIYSATLESIAGYRATGQALRLSFGLLLSLGQPLRQRFSAYVFLSGRKPELRVAEDE